MIGLAVVTYKRIDYLRQCLESLEKNNWGGASVRVVIADEERNDSYSSLGPLLGKAVFSFDKNKGVAVAKNRGLSYLLEAGCKHTFVMENDITMVSPDTCQAYIDYAKLSHVQHLNFAYHGPLNFPRQPHSYQGVCCHLDVTGAFAYNTREALEKVGLLDEHFHNAWEHVEHTFRMAKAGYTTPYYHFADMPNSTRYLREIDGSFAGSSIRDKAWEGGRDVNEGILWWTRKHGVFPPPGYEAWVKERGPDPPSVRVKQDLAAPSSPNVMPQSAHQPKLHPFLQRLMDSK